MNQNQLIASRCSSGFYAGGDGLAGLVTELSGFVPSGGNETWRKVERSISYMVEHLNQPLQVSTLAAQANVSPSHFFALFKQRTGCPPMDYFTRLRMSQARRILDSTSASVKEVAAALGYDDPFYFSRVFKSVNKIPPSEYRTRCKANKNDLKEPDFAQEPPDFFAANEGRSSRGGVQRMGGRREGENSAKKVLLSIP